MRSWWSSEGFLVLLFFTVFTAFHRYFVRQLNSFFFCGKEERLKERMANCMFACQKGSKSIAISF